MVSKLSSVGMPLPHQEVRIVDEQGDPVPAGSIGEIALRGPKVFAGYWRNPEATTDAIRKGWFHSGDMGYLDSDGYLYIADRKKDMVISVGRTLFSRSRSSGTPTRNWAKYQWRSWCCVRATRRSPRT